MDILYEKVSSRLALARKPNGAFLSNSVGLNSINVDGEDNEKLPKRGWTLVECGGLSPDELMRRHVFPFHRGNDTLEITDRPLKKIPFLRELNERRSVTKAALGNEPRTVSRRQPEKRIEWITLSTFFPEGKDFAALKKIVSDMKALRGSKYIVFQPSRQYGR